MHPPPNIIPDVQLPSPRMGTDDPVLETQEEREKFYQEVHICPRFAGFLALTVYVYAQLVKAREVERKTAIAQGKMDDNASGND